MRVDSFNRHDGWNSSSHLHVRQLQRKQRLRVEELKEGVSVSEGCGAGTSSPDLLPGGGGEEGRREEKKGRRKRRKEGMRKGGKKTLW